MNIITLLATLLYILMGIGFNNLTKRVGDNTEIVINIMLWPIGLIVFAFSEK